LASTNWDRKIVPASSTDWRAVGGRYFAYSFALRQRFGERVQKVSVDIGLTCPNVDGSVAVGGCVFCNNRSFSPSRRLPRRGITAQIEDAVGRLEARYGCRNFIAYFQPATNTYATVARLRAAYEEALEHPQIVGVAIGTRPDCVPDDVLDLLSDIASRTYLSVEYGIQTMHDRSLDWMNRGHHHAASVDAIQRSRGRGFAIGAHVILGLPGEAIEDLRDTARELARLRVDAVKIHNLYAVRNTPLAEQVERGEITLLARDEYVRAVVDFLELLPPTTVVERIGGDAPAKFLVAPDWCLDKMALRAALAAEFARRDTWQGRCWRP
jgi:radical SAM protein (TIGR01212 family)